MTRIFFVRTDGRMAAKRMGRPKMPKALKKGRTINIRVTAEQKAELVKVANHAGLGVSSWMLIVALREARKGEGGAA